MWRVVLEPNINQYSNLYIEAKIDENFAPQHVEITFSIHVTKQTNKVRKMLTKTLDEVFTREHFVIGEPKLISHKTFKLYLNKPIYFQITLRPGYAPETSREKTGYVGLVNEGTTCYMNSLLQTLFLISAFRETIYNLPPSNRNKIPDALKKLFKDMEKSNYPVSTQRLLISFGWGKEQWKEQHDVQEFNYTLSAALENTVNDVDSKGIYTKLFKGKTIQQIKCINVDYNSKIYEEFVDIQLDTKYHENIYDSLKTYFAPLELKGELKYQADGYGAQDAQKIIRFAELPPVLQIQLKRFDFNAFTGKMEKLNEKFEFYDEIDMDPYVLDEIKGDNIYRLFSILVHTGTPAAGHYYSFISPKLDNNWFRFNDESVDKAIPSQVINANWGGEMKDLFISDTGIITIGKNISETSAYMLVYIKLSEKDFILTEKLDKQRENVFEIIEIRDDNNESLESKKIEQCNIALISKEMIIQKKGFGLGLENIADNFHIINVKRGTNLENLKESILFHFDVKNFWNFEAWKSSWEFQNIDYLEELGKFSVESGKIDHVIYIECNEKIFDFVDNSWELVEEYNGSPDISTEFQEEVDISAQTIFVILKLFDGDNLVIVGTDILWENDAEAIKNRLAKKYLKCLDNAWLLVEKCDSTEISIVILDQRLNQFRNGDCIIIGNHKSENVVQDIINLQFMIDLQITYVDSTKCFDFLTHSNKLLKKYKFPQYLKTKISTKCSQLNLMKTISIQLRDYIPFMCPNHISLLDSDINLVRYTPHFELSKITHDGKIFYDIFPNDVMSDIEKVNLRLVNFNAEFDPINMIMIIGDENHIIQELINKIQKSITDNSRIEMFIFHKQKRIIILRLNSNMRLGDIIINQEIVIGYRLLTENEILNIHLEKIFICEVNKKWENMRKPYYQFISPNDTCQQVKQKIMEKVGIPLDFTLKVIKPDSNFKNIRVLSDLEGSQEIFLKKYYNLSIMVQHSTIDHLI